jgi:hypothetical protein
MSFFALLMSIKFLNIKKELVKIFKYNILIIVFIGLCVYLLKPIYYETYNLNLSNNKNSNFIEIEKITNLKSIHSRVSQLILSFELQSNTIFGAGLGNYYDYISKGRNLFLSQWQKYITLGAEEYPHNIFALYLAESGFIGFLIFVFLFLRFIYNDKINVFKKDNKNWEQATSIAFWTLFIYGFFNPPIPGSYQVLFWVLRAMLI